MNTSTTRIRDPIYGYVTVPPLCAAFMNQPEFQRLRFIQQLGLVQFVYPSAVHTRFEHSLGVMHMTGLMVDHLRDNGVEILDRWKHLAQLAGLMHDTGHLALSHFTDEIIKARGGMDHETRSISILRTINDRLHLLQSAEFDAVCTMISDSGHEQQQHTRFMPPFMYELVSNDVCGIDADRLDYLQRDAHHTGNPGYKPTYLLLCLTVNSDCHLAFKEKGREEVRGMFETRRRMYATVYRHPTVVKIEALVAQGIHKLDHLFADNKLLELTDAVLWSEMLRLPEGHAICARDWNAIASNTIAATNNDTSVHGVEKMGVDIDAQMARVPFV